MSISKGVNKFSCFLLEINLSNCETLTLVHSKIMTLPVVVRWSLNGEERLGEAGAVGQSVLSLDTEKETEVAEMTVSCQAENSEVNCQAVKLSQLSHWL